jgi:hypothetical protein
MNELIDDLCYLFSNDWMSIIRFDKYKCLIILNIKNIKIKKKIEDIKYKIDIVNL